MTQKTPPAFGNKPDNVLSIGKTLKRYLNEHWREGKTKQDPLFIFIDELFVGLGGFLLSLPLFFYLNHFLSTKPWGTVSVSPKFYVITTPPVGFWEAALSIGPIFFLGILGMVLTIIRKQTIDNKRSRIDMENRRLRVEENPPSILHPQNLSSTFHPPSSNIIIFLILWPTIQFLFLLFGHSFKIHPPRAFSGLYYLPLAYFSALFINQMSLIIRKKIEISDKKTENSTEIRRRISEKKTDFKQLFSNFSLIFLFSLFLFTLPHYLSFYKQHFYAFTDFKAFSTFAYPTKKQVEAYRFLEKNSPAGSGVLAMFEASNHLMGFSGNSTEMGMDHQTKTAFYANQMTEQQAKKFLIDNRFQYVYLGPQEQSTGGNLEKYPFLKMIFDNQEVKIFQVL